MTVGSVAKQIALVVGRGMYPYRGPRKLYKKIADIGCKAIQTVKPDFKAGEIRRQLSKELPRDEHNYSLTEDVLGKPMLVGGLIGIGISGIEILSNMIGEDKLKTETILYDSELFFEGLKNSVTDLQSFPYGIVA